MLFFEVYSHSPTNISEFVLYGMNLSYVKNRVDRIFVCRAENAGLCKYPINIHLECLVPLAFSDDFLVRILFLLFRPEAMPRSPARSSEGVTFIATLVKPLFVRVKAVDAALQLGARRPALELELAAVHL
jgi:hypothetical protein